MPLCFVLWQYTCAVEGVEPYTIGIRITSGQNAGDTRARVSSEGISLVAGTRWTTWPRRSASASFVLTAYGRMNAGTYEGDYDIMDGLCNLFFRI